MCGGLSGQFATDQFGNFGRVWPTAFQERAPDELGEGEFMRLGPGISSAVRARTEGGNGSCFRRGLWLFVRWTRSSGNGRHLGERSPTDGPVGRYGLFGRPHLSGDSHRMPVSSGIEVAELGKVARTGERDLGKPMARFRVQMNLHSRVTNNSFEINTED